MKYNVIKFFLSLFLFFSVSFGISFAEKYLYFYGDGCPHCKTVKKYFDDNAITEKFEVEKKEVWENESNGLIFAEYIKTLKINPQEVGVPFMVILGDDGKLSHKSGDTPIIQYFTNLLENKETVASGTVNPDEDKLETQNTTQKPKSRLSLFIALLTTSLADSINPCVFAVMLLLLSTILMRSKSHKKAVLSGLMFVFAIFLGYTFLGKMLLELL